MAKQASLFLHKVLQATIFTRKSGCFLSNLCTLLKAMILVITKSSFRFFVTKILIHKQTKTDQEKFLYNFNWDRIAEKSSTLVKDIAEKGSSL